MKAGKIFIIRYIFEHYAELIFFFTNRIFRSIEMIKFSIDFYRCIYVCNLYKLILFCYILINYNIN